MTPQPNEAKTIDTVGSARIAALGSVPPSAEDAAAVCVVEVKR